MALNQSPTPRLTIARAKKLFLRDEPIRALDELHKALGMLQSESFARQEKFELEVMLKECISELNRQPQIRTFLAAVARSKDVSLQYKPGMEKRLSTLIPIIKKGLLEERAAKEQHEADLQKNRKETLWSKGLEFLGKGDRPRAVAQLRVLAEEFGSEPGLVREIGEKLIGAGNLLDATDFLEQALELFPKDNKAYALATKNYTDLGEYAKAEALYMKAIQEFGKHPVTLLHLAELYEAWFKKEKVFQYASEAYALDPNNAEAKALMEKYV